LDVRDEGALVAGEFDTDLSTVEAEFGPGKASISSWQAAVGNLTVDTRNEALAVKGDLVTNLAGVQSEVMVDATPLDLALGGLKAELTSLDIVSKGDELSLGLAGRSTLEKLDTSLADSETRPGGKAALDLLSVDLQELAFSSGPTPAWRGRADLGMANLNAHTSEETLFTLAVGQLEAKGLESSPTMDPSKMPRHRRPRKTKPRFPSCAPGDWPLVKAPRSSSPIRRSSPSRASSPR
jgi:hypothetical protein